MTDPLLPSYLQFWGKARPGDLGGPQMHPAAYHGLDVAAVADVLLARSPRRLASLARVLSTSHENARRLFVTLVALHDVGKFAEAFQFMVPTLWPAALGARGNVEQRRHHTDIAFHLQNHLDLQSLLGADWQPTQIAVLWAAVAGHHGRPPSEPDETYSVGGMRQAGLDAALAYAKNVRACLGYGDHERSAPLARPSRAGISALSWSLAGLTNLADWIGSNQEDFPYCEPDKDLAAYWKIARVNAEGAVARAGILAAGRAHDATPRRLFPAIQLPSPLQRHLSEMALPNGPTLTIVEDVTGSGKTEAALILAARLLLDDRADGVFFALPTMATANAMFERLGEAYKRLFSDDATPSLVLAHGRTALHPGFQESILRFAARSDGAAEIEKFGDQSTAVCAAWIADDRRKAFLAHVGVGTIDQAFLGVLPVKHQALRLWGLADRVLIIDEAHA